MLARKEGSIFCCFSDPHQGGQKPGGCYVGIKNHLEMFSLPSWRVNVTHFIHHCTDTASPASVWPRPPLHAHTPRTRHRPAGSPTPSASPGPAGGPTTTSFPALRTWIWGQTPQVRGSVPGDAPSDTNSRCPSYVSLGCKPGVPGTPSQVW